MSTTNEGTGVGLFSLKHKQRLFHILTAPTQAQGWLPMGTPEPTLSNAAMTGWARASQIVFLFEHRAKHVLLQLVSELASCPQQCDPGCHPLLDRE
jgi:hypothetical protein